MTLVSRRPLNTILGTHLAFLRWSSGSTPQKRYGENTVKWAIILDSSKHSPRPTAHAISPA